MTESINIAFLEIFFPLAHIANNSVYFPREKDINSWEFFHICLVFNYITNLDTTHNFPT